MFRTVMAALGLAVLLPTVSQAALPDNTFFSKVPGSANALLALDVESAFASPLGRQEGWSKRFIETQHASLTSLPPTVDTVLMATQFSLGTMRPVWQLGLIKSSYSIPLTEVARLEGTSMTKTGDRYSVSSPRNAIFTIVGDRQLAAFAPADQQAYNRWIHGVDSNSLPGPSAYLRQGVSSAAGATMVLAFDLTDAIALEQARAAVSGSKHLVANSLDPNVYGRVLAGLRGFVLRTKVTNAIEGRLQIDFSEDLSEFKQHLPSIVRDLLAQGGASIDDLDEWKASVSGRSLVLEGNLKLLGAARLFSLFELPGGEFHNDAKPGEPGYGAGDSTAGGTVRYWKALNRILTELRSVKMTLDDESKYKKYSLWYETYAKRIDQLSPYNVDPALLAFGAKTANQLRTIANSMRGVPIKTQTEQGAAYVVYGVQSFGLWGGGISGINTNLGEVRQKQAKVIADDESARAAAWKQIDDGLAALRQTLADKYKVAF